VLKLIIQLLLAVLIFRLVGSVVGRIRGGQKRRAAFDRSPKSGAAETSDYKDLSPYEIEDAEYEDLPRQE
jgi:hypothetical protein